LNFNATKILFVTYEYPTYTPFGGIAFYYAKLVQILSLQGFEVTVVAAKLVEKEKNAVEINQTYNLKEVFIICSDSSAFQKLAIEWLFQNKTKYDIVEVPEYGALFYDYVITDELKTFAAKIVVRVHGTTLLAAIYDVPNNYRKTLVYIYNQFLLNSGTLKLLKYTKSKKYKIAKANFREFRLIENADIVTTTSNKMAAFVNKYWLKINKTIVFPNPSQYNIGEYEKKPFDKTDFKVSYVNRLQYLKGFDLYFKLSKNFPNESNIHFSAFGSFSQLNIGYTKHEISETVELKGFVNANELIEVYKKSHIVIVPSRFESFSNVALEAMGFGCLIIVSDNMGISEHIVHGTNGFVFKSGKYYSLETVFTEIIRMESGELERVSFNAYRTALKLSENKELLEFYHSV
jgi:glycosyltransferase involved in cell wall biosynthesis